MKNNILILLTILLLGVITTSCTFTDKQRFQKYVSEAESNLTSFEIIEFGEMDSIFCPINPMFYSLRFSEHNLKLIDKINKLEAQNSSNKAEQLKRISDEEDRWFEKNRYPVISEVIISNPEAAFFTDQQKKAMGRKVKYRLNGQLMNDVVVYDDKQQIECTFRQLQQELKEYYSKRDSYLSDQMHFFKILR